MATGKCRHCGSEPVAFDAKQCPHCGGKDPNPGTLSRFIGFGLLGGLLLGGFGGALWGAFGGLPGGGVVAAIVGFLGFALVGCLVGLIGGPIIGLGAMAFDKLCAALKK